MGWARTMPGLAEKSRPVQMCSRLYRVDIHLEIYVNFMSFVRVDL